MPDERVKGLLSGEDEVQQRRALKETLKREILEEINAERKASTQVVVGSDKSLREKEQRLLLQLKEYVREQVLNERGYAAINFEVNQDNCVITRLSNYRVKNHCVMPYSDYEHDLRFDNNAYGVFYGLILKGLGNKGQLTLVNFAYRLDKIDFDELPYLMSHGDVLEFLEPYFFKKQRHDWYIVIRNDTRTELKLDIMPLGFLIDVR